MLALDLAPLGFSSADVDDFFRPLGSLTARVNGSYSMRCYWESLEAAFLDHCARAGRSPSRRCDTDYFVLHTPFRNMPETAMEKLLERVLGYDAARARSFLAEKSFAAARRSPGGIGNIYTGSLTAALAFLLDDRYGALGEGIVGKTVLLASYGSGSTMVVVKAASPGRPAGHLPLGPAGIFSSARQRPSRSTRPGPRARSSRSCRRGSWRTPRCRRRPSSFRAYARMDTVSTSSAKPGGREQGRGKRST